MKKKLLLWLSKVDKDVKSISVGMFPKLIVILLAFTLGASYIYGKDLVFKAQSPVLGCVLVAGAIYLVVWWVCEFTRGIRKKE